MIVGKDIRAIPGYLFKYCDNCKRLTDWTIYEKSDCIGFFGIIVFRMNKDHHKMCNNCKRISEWVTKEEIAMSYLGVRK